MQDNINMRKDKKNCAAARFFGPRAFFGFFFAKKIPKMGQGQKVMAKARKKCFVSANIKKCCALNIATKKVFSSEIPKSRNRFLTHLNAENIFYFFSI